MSIAREGLVASTITFTIAALIVLTIMRTILCGEADAVFGRFHFCLEKL